MIAGLRFGLGLIGIGKPWGHANPVVPAEREALNLLASAWDLGVRYFDTAPSYGISEERLGRFLASLTADERSSATIATKFGEHWDAARSEPYVDHSYEALAGSLDASLARLGRIEILQLHKTTPQVLRGPDLARAWDYARSLDIPCIGASVSDQESAQLTVANPALTVIQAPFNLEQRAFGSVLQQASDRGMLVAVNRPFAMGRLLYERPDVSRREAFAFVAAQGFRGVVLTGTKSTAHLKENWTAFHEAIATATSPDQ